MVKATPQPLCPRGRAATNCVGSCLGPRAVLDERGKFRAHQDSIIRSSRPHRVRIPTELSGSTKRNAKFNLNSAARRNILTHIASICRVRWDFSRKKVSGLDIQNAELGISSCLSVDRFQLHRYVILPRISLQRLRTLIALGLS
jgi:hypothetical protein